jgi:adenylate kinase
VTRVATAPRHRLSPGIILLHLFRALPVWLPVTLAVMAFRDGRSRPNILVTGTPGTGKTTLSALLAQRIGFAHVCLGEVVKQEGLHAGYIAEFDTYELDEDKICDYLEPIMATGGIVLDFHTIDFFPERWVDVVVVLRTDNDILYPRLEARCATSIVLCNS